MMGWRGREGGVFPGQPVTHHQSWQGWGGCGHPGSYCVGQGLKPQPTVLHNGYVTLGQSLNLSQHNLPSL